MARGRGGAARARAIGGGLYTRAWVNRPLASRVGNRACDLMGVCGSRQMPVEESHGFCREWPNISCSPYQAGPPSQGRNVLSQQAVFQSILITPPSLVALPL